MNKRGDLVDLALWSSRKALENPYSEITEQYPEDVKKILALFLKLWMLPKEAIPNHKQQSKMSKWINDLRQLYKLIPENKTEKYLNRVFENYKNSPFTVSSPGAIINLTVSTIGEINREEKEKMDKFMKAQEEYQEYKQNDAFIAQKPVKIEEKQPEMPKKREKTAKEIEQDKDDAEWLANFLAEKNKK